MRRAKNFPLKATTQTALSPVEQKQGSVRRYVRVDEPNDEMIDFCRTVDSQIRCLSPVVSRGLKFNLWSASWCRCELDRCGQLQRKRTWESQAE